MTGLLLPTAILSLSFARAVAAHEHDTSEIPYGQAVSDQPIDAILWIHIIIMAFTFGLIFPVGMVLGMVRSRWHVPLQTAGAMLAILGYFLGHMHKGRQFRPNIHAKFAPFFMFILICQVVMGVYLKLHLVRGINSRIRPSIVKAHGIVAVCIPVLSWAQMLFGGITAVGFCRGGHLGQCLAHFIMGSAFIGYGILLTILLLVGQLWLQRTGRSQEFFDSAVITTWGFINTFTEHRWGQAWVHNDLQHTTMGIIWWCAGLLGMWLSRTRDGRPKRNLVPAMVIFLTGFAMSAHPQELPISEKVHAVFGYTLMGAGITRVIEISFVLKDKNGISEDGSEINSFQFLTPFLLCAAGFIFMGATEEQMQLLDKNNVTHVSWLLILFSLAFLMFLLVNLLIHIYSANDSTAPNSHIKDDVAAVMNGHARTPSERLAQDAEEFELAGLMSDDEIGPQDLEPPPFLKTKGVDVGNLR